LKAPPPVTQRGHSLALVKIVQKDRDAVVGVT